MFLLVFSVHTAYGSSSRLVTRHDIKTNNYSSLESSLEVSDVELVNITDTMNITTFLNPDTAFKVHIEFLRKATSSIYLEIYSISSKPLVQELINAKSRNNSMEIIVIVSHNRASYYENDYTNKSVTVLKDNGIIVKESNSTFTFTHSKFIVIDHRYTFVQSSNWASSSISPDNRYNGGGNREWGVVIDSTSVASKYEELFFFDYAIATDADYYPGAFTIDDLAGDYPSTNYTPVFDTESFVGTFTVHPVFSPNNSLSMITSLIDSAKSEILVSQDYIYVNWSSGLSPVVEALENAVKRGVDVRVIISPGTSTANDTVEYLTSKGIAVAYINTTLFNRNHNKGLIIDGKKVLISSINWSENSIMNNREAGIVIYDQNVANYYKIVFMQDWETGEYLGGGNIVYVEIENLIQGEVLSGTKEIIAAAVGNISHVELKIDTTIVGNMSLDGTKYKYTIDTTQYTDGIHEIKIIGHPINSSTLAEDSIKINIINQDEWKILISEVYYDAENEPEEEFVEIVNAFDFDVLVSNWKLTDLEKEVKFSSDLILPAKDTLVFAKDLDAFKNLFGFEADAQEDFTLANSGDEVVLFDPRGNEIDAVAWGNSDYSGVTPHPGTDEGYSLQRDPIDKDTNDCSVDFIAAPPDPGNKVEDTTSGGGNIPGFEITLALAAVIPLIIASIKRKRFKE